MAVFMRQKLLGDLAQPRAENRRDHSDVRAVMFAHDRTYCVNVLIDEFQ